MVSAASEYRILDRMLDPVGDCLTPGVAAKIADLRAGPRLQKRIDELAEKNSAGTLTAREDAEYDAYVEALDVIAILQAKARKISPRSSRRARRGLTTDHADNADQIHP